MKIDVENMNKLKALGNKQVIDIVESYIDLCKPASVKILTGSEGDCDYIRQLALRHREETKLSLEGHRVHFDGYFDQGRDREKTKVLLLNAISRINSMDRKEGLEEIRSLLDSSMAGREMFVAFFCLGPQNSRFSIPAMQITDSAYVIHSEQMMYRPGYDQFKLLNGSKDFFHFVHSSGELENGVSKNHDKKRIYIDLEEERVFSVNTQYAGNSMGLKKLALRLAIKRANESDWLCEHMFLMGVHNAGRRTYFCGAFPSSCGKTSTAMTPGQGIVGDDIVYMKRNGNRLHAVNVEQGIFGILQDVNPIDDPLIYNALVTPKDLIFSNVLVAGGKPYWLGVGDIPQEGVNYAGEWRQGNRDAEGNEILPAHKNARYTMRIEELQNADPALHNPEGVPVDVIIYGGRDYETSPPVVQSFDWKHGVFLGAALESETTAATIGQVGVRRHDPMANLDFLVVPLAKYISNHLKMGTQLGNPPLIFATNYFLKSNGKFLNDKLDKKVWLLWMEGRVHGDYDAIATPIGYIPRYEDLHNLFRQVFDKEYSKEDYRMQFELRIPMLLERLDRIEALYKKEEGMPEELFVQISSQRARLLDAREKHRSDIISPFAF